MSQSLTDEQTAAVRAWAEEGADLPTIQKRLEEEFELRMTFMDCRFLIGDLGIELKSEEEPEQKVEPELQSAPASDTPLEPAAPSPGPDQLPGTADADNAGGVPADDAGAAPEENVTVTISELQRPGMMASGTVTFAAGQTAEWYLDQMGQLGMNPSDPEFRPTPGQMMAFQRELQRVAQSKGF